MDIPLLRTLTLKSSLGFGKFALMTIQQIIDMQKPDYIRWVYYNIKGISFNDEVLKKIYILERDRINKPGSNPEKYEEVTNRLFYSVIKTNGLRSFKMKSRIKKVLKNEYKRKELSRVVFSSKYYLQAKNQGH